VEGYWPEATVEAFTIAAERLDKSLDDLRAEGFAIRAVAAMLVPGDEAAYWVVDGPTADVVARACERAGMAVDRIVAALDLRPRQVLRPTGPGSAAAAQPPDRRQQPAASCRTGDHGRRAELGGNDGNSDTA
jgi:hypothetical protein